MTIRVLPRELSRIDHARATTLPKWIRPETKQQRYWHIPRNGEWTGKAWLVDLWCGPHRWVAPEFMTDATPNDMQCGTCVGRFAGYERDNRLVFAPRSAFDLPQYCPARCDDSKTCALCGGKQVFTRGYSGWNESRHAAGPLLVNVQPCPHHGWKWLVADSRNGQHVVCNRHVGFGYGKCGHVLERKA